MAKDQSKVQKKSNSVSGGQSRFSGGEQDTGTVKDLLVLVKIRTEKRKLQDRRRDKEPQQDSSI